MQGWWVPPHLPFTLLIWPVQKTEGSWRMTVDYQILIKYRLQCAAAIPHVVSLHEQINTISGIQYAAIDLANAFFSISIH